MGPLTVTLNGEEKQTNAINVLQLVNELNLTIDHIIIELNNTIVSSKDFGITPLNNKDNIEIIRYIGGGA